MTRDEALNKGVTAAFINSLEKLGLIKFDEEIKCWYQSENHIEWGTVKILEHDKELHIWIGGKHRYKLSVNDV